MRFFSKIHKEVEVVREDYQKYMNMSQNDKMDVLYDALYQSEDEYANNPVLTELGIRCNVHQLEGTDWKSYD